MSVESLTMVLHHSESKGTDKLVLIGIANHAGDGGAWPTVATLARYANVTERAVQSSLVRLVAAGELVIERQAGGSADMPGWQRPNRYDVTVTCPPTCDRTPQHRHQRLAQVPADLWTKGVKPTSPGEADFTGGVKQASPEWVKPTSPKPSLEPSNETHQAVAYLTGPRARTRDLRLRAFCDTHQSQLNDSGTCTGCAADQKAAPG